MGVERSPGAGQTQPLHRWEQGAGGGHHRQESMKPSEAMRKAATFTRTGRSRMDFKTKATKSVLPCALFDVDCCYGNERNLGFYAIKEEG